MSLPIMPTNIYELKRSMEHLLKLEDRHVIGATGEPAFAGTWGNLNAGWEVCLFYKTPDGHVVIEGVANNATAAPPGDALFTLLPLYRPRAHIIKSGVANNAAARFSVLSTGVVTYDAGAAGNTWVSIGCIFRPADA